MNEQIQNVRLLETKEERQARRTIHERFQLINQDLQLRELFGAAFSFFRNSRFA
jgi:hypothetical protein